MAVETGLRWALNLVTVLLATSTAILGILLINHLFKNKLKHLFDNLEVFIFSFLIFGYSCFAVAEVCWFLILGIMDQTLSASMPDFYWVVGSVFLLLAFCIMFIQLYRQHGELNHLLIMLVLGVIILGGISYFTYSLVQLEAPKTSGDLFLSYFYPLMSALILVLSFGVYLFFERIDRFAHNLLLLSVANAAFLIGDLLYTVITIKKEYGFYGFLSDVSYIVAYFLCSFSFLWLLFHLRRNSQPEENENSAL